MKSLSDEEVRIVEGFRANVMRRKKPKAQLPPWYKDDNEILRLSTLDSIDLFYEMAKTKTLFPKVVWVYEVFSHNAVIGIELTELIFLPQCSYWNRVDGA